jgi:hypothetical protein
LPLNVLFCHLAAWPGELDAGPGVRRASMVPFIDRVIEGGTDLVTAPDDALSVRDYLDLMLVGERVMSTSETLIRRASPSKRRTHDYGVLPYASW